VTVHRPIRIRKVAPRVVAVGVLGVLVLGACSSPGSTGTPDSAQSVDPNAAEVNPPGDIPDNQVFVVYADPSGSFTVKVPEGWASSETAGGVTFTDKLNSVRIESSTTPSAPTVESVTAQDVPAIASTTDAYVAGDVTTVARAAGSAVLATYEGDAAADPVTGKVVHDAFERYAFWHDGRLVVLTLSGPVGADNVDPWKIVSDSLAWSA
jgi:hypothetical protein